MLKLDSPLFDKSKREEVFREIAYQSAVDFEEKQREKMENAEVSGREYERRNEQGFRRLHRASARGERITVDSRNLVDKALKTERTGDYSAATYIDAEIAPYAEILQDELDRQVMTDEDAEDAQIEFNARCEAALQSLL